MIKQRCTWELDYLTVAKPLSFEDIRKDIDDLAAHHDREPQRIVIWHHQWDWLVKSLQPLRHNPAPIRDVLFGSSIMEVQARGYNKDDPPTIYGIPVEIQE